MHNKSHILTDLFISKSEALQKATKLEHLATWNAGIFCIADTNNLRWIYEFVSVAQVP